MHPLLLTMIMIICVIITGSIAPADPEGLGGIAKPYFFVAMVFLMVAGYGILAFFCSFHRHDQSNNNQAINNKG